MDLRTYMEGLSTGEREDFARRCGTSGDYLAQIAVGIRKPKVQLAVTISKESARKVACEDLIPDVDWEYLRQREHAA